MDNPSQVGSDRIVIAVAALAEYEPPLTLLDLGTATTIEVVGEGSTYLGGCIIPGGPSPLWRSADGYSSFALPLFGQLYAKTKVLSRLFVLLVEDIQAL